MAETVTLELKIPRPVWNALTYYMRYTLHWHGDEYIERSAHDYIIEMISAYLRMEADHPTDAEDYLKHVMRTEHLPNL